jgi:uncharacterized protein YndB with AHSA1/START domain
MEDKKQLTLTRTFDAPKDLVWKAWTDPELVKEWWGPRGFSSEVTSWDLKAGGEIDLVMLAGEELGQMCGMKAPMQGKFDEIVEGEKIEFSASAIVNGKAVLETQTTVTFESEGEKTKLSVYIVVTMTTPEAAGPLAGMEMGWNQQLDKLGEFLGKEEMSS